MFEAALRDAVARASLLKEFFKMDTSHMVLPLLDVPAEQLELVDLRINRMIEILAIETSRFIAEENRFIRNELELLRTDLTKISMTGQEEIEGALKSYVQDVLRGRVKNGFRKFF
jgi:hypothetical protein